MTSNEYALNNICDEIRKSCKDYIGEFNNPDNYNSYERGLNSLLKKYDNDISKDLKFKLILVQQSSGTVFALLYYKNYNIINYSFFTIEQIIDKIKHNSYEVINDEIILSNENIVVRETFKIDLNLKED